MLVWLYNKMPILHYISICFNQHDLNLNIVNDTLGTVAPTLPLPQLVNYYHDALTQQRQLVAASTRLRMLRVRKGHHFLQEGDH